jgi:hypothetical protein
MMILGVGSEVPTADLLCYTKKSFNNFLFCNMWPVWVFERLSFSFDSHTCNINDFKEPCSACKYCKESIFISSQIRGEGICLLNI